MPNSAQYEALDQEPKLLSVRRLCIQKRSVERPQSIFIEMIGKQ